MTFPSRLAAATRNPGKIREIRRICADWPVEWLLADDAHDETLGAGAGSVIPADQWPEVEETGLTYLENALLKARAVAIALDVPAVADDSGIEVDVLGGSPGPRSARFAGEHATDQENLRLMIRRIVEVPEAMRTARYVCVAACAWPDGRTLWAEASCEGRLILEPRGTGGFGYDPIMVPQGGTRSMAELSAAEKDAISHRGKALRALGEMLRGEG